MILLVTIHKESMSNGQVHQSGGGINNAPNQDATDGKCSKGSTNYMERSDVRVKN